ncbi:MAG: haloacid dehalogenase-like hydrolase [Elusimicrobiota bacterium]|jgi:hypothetical protein|nr:haloacid dehalogenase-like hydrolase [Elusimicrobiota bacterium]
MLKKLKSMVSLVLTAAFVFALSTSAFSADSKVLAKGNWDTNTRAQIQKMITLNGNTSKTYDANKKPYAVFDWDQTCIFNDTEEALFRYMIQNVLFKATPKEFAKALKEGIPDTKKAFDKEFNNKAGKSINLDLMSADLEKDYKFIYDNYINNKKLSLADLQKTNEFLDWRAKFAMLYEAVGGTFSADVSYPWVLYFFVGMTPAEVAAVSEASNDQAFKDPIGKFTWASPDALPGKAGVVSYSYKSGLRIQREMSDLMAVMRANGIDVYVCSASHEQVVKVFAGLAKYGYNVPAENVIGMKTKIQNGKYLAEYDYSNGYPQTQGKGKTTAITQILVKKYGYDPIFIASDSSGDYNMATEFTGTQLTLMINRLYANTYGKLGLLAYGALQKGIAPRYVLQGRDENKGQFRPSIATIKMGTDKEAIFNAAIDPTVKK